MSPVIRFQCPEYLFQPWLLDEAARDGIQHIAFHAIQACDASEQPELLDQIVLSGGTTMMPGFAERLQQEVEHLSGKKVFS
jgi:actin-related protein